MKAIFEFKGYFLEYMIDNKLIGTTLLDNPDREEIGYYSRIDSIAEENIVLDNKKVIKKGTKFFTRIYPLCGKTI